MGIPVLVLGESGSGKSSSLRNFEPDEIGIFNVASKPLPFRKKMNKIDAAGYRDIFNVLRKAKLKKYVIDDSQYLLCFALFDKAKETGYNKFTDMAKDFYDLIQLVIKELPDDVIVYFLHHVENVDGKLKAKTIGKMLDEKLTVEGLFSIVLLCETDGETFHFVTHPNGYSTVKTPIDMFENKKIDNDLAIVDSIIRDYYNLTTITTEEKTNE